jgi:hypothetical protein
MVKYFLLFTFLGFLISRTIATKKIGLYLIFAITIFWGTLSQPIWGLVTLCELLLGFVLSEFTNRKTSHLNDDEVH